MGGDEHIEMAGVTLDALGEAGGGEELVEGVADVFQLGVKFFAVAVEPVLQTFEQVGGKVGVVAGAVAVGGDDLETFLDEGLITLGGAGEAALVEPGGGPGDGVEQALAVAMVVGDAVGVEALTGRRDRGSRRIG